jgi:hypothetical protein
VIEINQDSKHKIVGVGTHVRGIFLTSPPGSTGEDGSTVENVVQRTGGMQRPALFHARAVCESN